MPSVTSSAFALFLEAQRTEYGTLLPERLAQINSLWHEVLNDEAPAQALVCLERCVHTVAGSSGTFGFAALGDAARVLELALGPLLNAPHALTPTAKVEINQVVEALMRSLPGETAN